MSQCRHVPMRRGSAVFWDWRVPHANAAHHLGSEAREAVYLGFLPDIEINRRFAQEQLAALLRCETVSDGFQWSKSKVAARLDLPSERPDTFSWSPLGRRLFGLDCWDKPSSDVVQPMTDNCIDSGAELRTDTMVPLQQRDDQISTCFSISANGTALQIRSFRSEDCAGVHELLTEVYVQAFAAKGETLPKTVAKYIKSAIKKDLSDIPLHYGSSDCEFLPMAPGASLSETTRDSTAVSGRRVRPRRAPNGAGQFWVAVTGDDRVRGMVGVRSASCFTLEAVLGCSPVSAAYDSTDRESLPRSQVAEIKHLAVAPDLHRCGLGTLLVSLAERFCSRHGYSHITLSTLNRLDAAIAFYTRLGYRLVRSADVSPPAPSDTVDRFADATAATTGTVQSAAVETLQMVKTLPSSASAVPVAAVCLSSSSGAHVATACSPSLHPPRTIVTIPKPSFRTESVIRLVHKSGCWCVDTLIECIQDGRVPKASGSVMKTVSGAKFVSPHRIEDIDVGGERKETDASCKGVDAAFTDGTVVAFALADHPYGRCCWGSPKSYALRIGCLRVALL